MFSANVYLLILKYEQRMRERSADLDAKVDEPDFGSIAIDASEDAAEDLASLLAELRKAYQP